MNTENKSPVAAKYILKPEMLKVGDVICTRAATKTSRAIRKALSCDYSHVLLYVSDSSCIHADSSGVHSLNIQRLLFDHIDDVKVFRLKDANGAVIDKAVEFARRKVGTEYSKIDAARSGVARSVKSKVGIDSKYQFCSRLVAEAFEAGGVFIVEVASLCTPADVPLAACFDAVSDTARVAHPKEIAFALDETKDTIAKQTKITNVIFSSARRILGTDSVQTWEDLVSQLIEQPDADEEIAAMIRESGYMTTIWAEDMFKEPGRYFKSNYGADDALRFVSIAGIEKELGMARRDLEKYNQGRLVWADLYAKFPLTTFFDQLMLSQLLVSLSLQRIELFDWLGQRKLRMR